MLNNTKTIPIKNYIYLLLILITSVALVYYMYLWFIEYEKEQNTTTTINDVMQIINYNELDSYLIENKDAIIYATIQNNKDIRKFEKKLERVIKQNDISNKILYLDITDNNNQNNKYQILDTYQSAPVILVYKNADLVNKYEIAKNNYDIKKVTTFLTNIGVINND